MPVIERLATPHWVHIPSFLKTKSPTEKFLICLKLHCGHFTIDMTLSGAGLANAYPLLTLKTDRTTNPKDNTATVKYSVARVTSVLNVERARLSV